MRQSGRILPEYRSARKSLSLSALHDDAALCARLGVLPVERFGFDAAAVVTDLRLPLAAMGLLTLAADDDDRARPAPAGQPVTPLRLRLPADQDFGHLPDIVSLTVRGLAGAAPALAQVGAPFTLAAFVTDPGAPAQPERLRGLLYAEPAAWAELAEVTTAVGIRSAQLQVEAGAQAVHVYDTWAGGLDEDVYRRHVLPWSKRLLEAIAALRVPAIHYALRGGHLLEAMAEAGGEVIGVDWRVPLDEAFERVGPGRGVQGNLDPTLLLSPLERLLGATASALSAGAGRPGFIFSLGHGLLPSTPPSAVHALVRYARSFFS